MALAVTTVTVPFPAGVVAATLAGTLTAVALKTVPLGRAELQVLVAADQATPTDYRPVMIGNTPLSLPVGNGGMIAFPQNIIPPLAKIQVALTNYGGASADVYLVTQ